MAAEPFTIACPTGTESRTMARNRLRYSAFNLFVGQSGASLIKVEDYLRNAAECRKLADRAENEDQRRNFTIIAEAWERLAEDRRRRVGNANQNDEETSSKATAEVVDLITGKSRSR